jgi:hypothetical protein
MVRPVFFADLDGAFCDEVTEGDVSDGSDDIALGDLAAEFFAGICLG